MGEHLKLALRTRATHRPRVMGCHLTAGHVSGAENVHTDAISRHFAVPNGDVIRTQVKAVPAGTPDWPTLGDPQQRAEAAFCDSPYVRGWMGIEPIFDGIICSMTDFIPNLPARSNLID